MNRVELIGFSCNFQDLNTCNLLTQETIFRQEKIIDNPQLSSDVGESADIGKNIAVHNVDLGQNYLLILNININILFLLLNSIKYL